MDAGASGVRSLKITFPAVFRRREYASAHAKRAAPADRPPHFPAPAQRPSRSSATRVVSTRPAMLSRTK